MTSTKLALILTAMAACFASSAIAQQITFGTYSASNSKDAIAPIYRSSASSAYDASRFACIYTASDLSGLPGGATITDLEWYKDNTGATVTGAAADMNIYLRNTSATNYTTSDTWTNLTTGAVLVYSTNSQTIPGTTGWMSFGSFNGSPFTYGGASIEVLIEWDISAYSGAPSTDQFLWATEPYSGSATDSRVIGDGDTTLITTLDSTGLLEDHYTYQPLLRLSYNGGTPGTSISNASTPSNTSLSPSDTDVVVMDINAYSITNNYDLDSIRFDQTGSIPDIDISNVTLYRDDNSNGIVDGDTPLGTGTLSGAVITFSGSPLQQLNTSGPIRLMLAIDIVATATPGDTVSFEITASSSVSFSGGTDLTSYPVNGANSVVVDPNVPVHIYLSMDEATGTTTSNDAIPGAGSATITFPTVPPAWVTPGRLGASALDFDTGSASALDTGWTSTLSSGDSWTIETWLRVHGTSGYVFRMSGGMYLYYSTSSGLYLSGTGGTPSTTIYFGTTPSINTWYHVAISYDATAQEVRLYLNGALDSTNSRTAVADGSLIVGGYTATSTLTFKGDLDEFRFWDKTRSQGDIQSTMFTELPPIDSTVMVASGSDDLINNAATDQVVMDMGAFTLVNNNDLDSLTFTKNGSISDADVTSLRLYLDVNDNGVVDGGDTTLGTGTLTSGMVTFSGSPLQTLNTSGGSRLLLAADIAATAAPGDTLAFSIASASDVTWSGGADLTTYPLNSALHTIAGAAANYPYVQGFETALPYYNSSVSTASNLYPTVVSVGSTPGNAAAAGTGSVTVTAGPVSGSSPNTGNGMMDFAGSTNIGAGALDLLFDLSGLSAGDTVQLDFWWNDEGMDPDTTTSIHEHFIGVFVSTDGGANWELAAFQFPVTQTGGVWYQESINLSALMSAASLTFTNQTLIRFQMAEDSTGDHLLLDDISLDIIPPSLTATQNTGADSSATAGASTSAWVGSFELASYGIAETANSVTLTQIGTTNSATLSNLTLWEDTDANGVLSTGDSQVGSPVSALTGNSLTFSGSPLYSFSLGAAQTFFITADVASSAATLSEIQFEITAATDISATPGPSNGNFPITGTPVPVVPLPLAGNYTINQTSGDFTDIGDAFDTLELAGVAGPVTLTITDSATYNATPSYSLGIDNTQPVPNVTAVAGVSATNSITLTVGTGQTPVIVGSASGAILAGQSTASALTGRGGLVINQSYVTVDGLEVTGGPDFGIIAQGNTSVSLTTTDITFRRCIVHDIPNGPGIAFMGQNSGFFTNGIIENNFVWNCFTASGNPTTSSVLLVNTGGSITVRNAANGSSIVRHNTVLHTSTFTTTGAYYAYSSSASYPISDLSNNIFICTDASVPAAYLYDVGYIPTVSDFNCWFAQTQSNLATLSTFASWQSSGLDINGLNTDPKLISTSGTIDLHLAADSPCLNPSGQNSTVTDDIDGDSRPLGITSDIGADEGDYPQIAVLDGLINIPQNGSRNIGGVSTTTGQTVTLTIANNGSQNLNLTGTPTVGISLGSNLTSATVVSAQPSSVSIAPAGSTTFDVFIQPSASGGAFSLTLTIDNNTVFTPFTFDVTGNGIIPNSPAVADTASGSSLSGSQNGPFSLALNPGATLANVEIELTDPESDNITVTAITPPGTAPSGIIPPSIPSAGQPITLAWTGTADASNAPTTYTWQVTFHDAVNSTPVTVDVEISINNIAPTHAIANASGGDGSSGTPYTAEYTESMGTTDSISLASVSDANTGQSLTLGTPVPGGSNPTGGVGFGFSLTGGMLVVAPAGTLTANDVGTHTFDIDVDDGVTQTTISVSIDVAGIPTITTGSPLANGEQGQTYTTVSLAATGGTGALTFAVTAGALPAGLSLSATGDLSGLPTTAGAYNFTVSATDTLNIVGSKVFDLTIDPPALGNPTITAPTFADGLENTAYTPVNIQVTGGTAPFTFSVSGGSLPPGMVLSSSGMLSGTPTTAGVYTFDITVTDAAFATDTATNLTLEVKAPVSSGGGSGGGGGGCVATGTNTSLWGVLLGAFVLLLVVSRFRTTRD